MNTKVIFMKKNAFTMIELVFVIVVLGILSAIAIPRFAATRTDAQIAKARSDIASIRSAIITERQSRLFRGDNTFIPTLDSNDGILFNGQPAAVPARPLLAYGITAKAGNGHWQQTGATTYTYTVQGVATTFTYIPGPGVGAGTFDCTASSANKCAILTKN